MRILILALAYISAWIAGALAATTALVIDDATAMPALFFGSLVVAGIGAVVVSLLALPAIIYTEKRGHSQWWHFLLAGLGLGAIICTVIAFDQGNPMIDRPRTWGFLASRMAASLVITSVIAMVFWLIAWRLFPPKAPGADATETFE